MSAQAMSLQLDAGPQYKVIEAAHRKAAAIAVPQVFYL